MVSARPLRVLVLLEALQVEVALQVVAQVQVQVPREALLAPVRVLPVQALKAPLLPVRVLPVQAQEPPWGQASVRVLLLPPL